MGGEEQLTLGRNVHPIRERRLDMLAGLGYGIARGMPVLSEVYSYSGAEAGGVP